jgi:hypothetical protein
MRLSKEKIVELRSELYKKPDTRIYLCEQSFLMFAIYYFLDYFAYETAEFQYDLFSDFEDLVAGRVPSNSGAWVTFAEGAKTSIAKMGLTWIACYKKKEYVNVDSNDGENAERLLFDVVINLQTNQKIVKDFGQIYNAPRTKDEATVKRVSNFITNKGTRFEAWSTQESPRGRVHGKQRPDFWLLDDIENKITIRSGVKTKSVIDHIDEIKRGMSPQACILLLGNYLIEEGSVAYFMKSVTNSGGLVRFVPVVDKKGNIAWADKYVHTDEEAIRLNATLPPDQVKVSLETKKRELNAGGNRIYEVEMLLDPASAGTSFFDRRKVDIALEKCVTPTEDKAGFLLWGSYNPMNAYAIGADTGKGNGGDHSTTALIDFTSTPNRQIGSYANNRIPSDQFAWELKRQGDMFGTCLIAPEKNAESGGSCLATLKTIYPVDMIYRQVPHDRLADIPTGTHQTGELGWETNNATKYMILNDFKSSWEAGEVIIEDERILKEMKSFTFTDADEMGSARVGHSTRHFDLLIAVAIAWHMRKHAMPKPKATNNYNQPAYEPTGLNTEDYHQPEYQQPPRE